MNSTVIGPKLTHQTNQTNPAFLEGMKTELPAMIIVAVVADLILGWRRVTPTE